MRFRQRLEEESERTQRLTYAELLQMCKDRQAHISYLPWIAKRAFT